MFSLFPTQARSVSSQTKMNHWLPTREETCVHTAAWAAPRVCRWIASKKGRLQQQAEVLLWSQTAVAETPGRMTVSEPPVRQV